ncbi:MAG: glycosyltransferase family 2 protein [Mesorhizobium sp.]|nr:glycosyltransferase family 2 protein [Mesorhizobium sp.]MBN9244841.1 glycosyltransferase family 2 protein [Mesorhizobium sp.]
MADGQVGRTTESGEYGETGVVDSLLRETIGPKYSVVVPVYNDGALAPAFCEEIAKTFRGYLGVEDLVGHVELIFVNDGSRNDSLGHLKAMTARYPFVRVIDLSRNFGQHIAIACGLSDAHGDVVLRMNIDMQDHPDQIPLLLDAMHTEHLDLVVGQYAVRESPWANRLTAWLYFYLFEFLTGFSSPQNTSPLRAMSRRFVDAYNRLTERSRFPQGLDQWLGFDHKYVPIEHSPRSVGKSSYNFWSRLRLGIEGILYFSNRPLTLIAIAGFALSLIGLALGLYVVLARLFWVALLPGYASIVSVGLIAFGIQLGCMGVVGLYVARIFAETQNRPLYIVKACYTHAGKEQGKE